jgi:translation initiation factor IF-2
MNEIGDLDDMDYNLFDPITADITGLISEADVQEIAQSLDNQSLAALMLFENLWATEFRDAVLKAEGELLFSERVPNRVIEDLLASQATA